MRMESKSAIKLALSYGEDRKITSKNRVLGAGGQELGKPKPPLARQLIFYKHA